MAVKTILVDGIEHLVILERGTGDGGGVVCYVSPDKGGFHVNKREWYSDPSLAQATFDAVDDVKARSKRAEALDMVTGKISAIAE